MSPRRRHPRNQGLPDGLRVRGGYYSYVHPIDGREKGLGRDRKEAIQQARRANAAIWAAQGKVQIEDWATGKGPAVRTWAAWCDRFQKLTAEKKLSKHTRAKYATMLRRARADFAGELAADAIDVLMVAQSLNELKATKAPMAKAYRSYLKEVFRACCEEGWRKDNPAEVTAEIAAPSRRARLELPQFLAIYNDPLTQPWLRNAMALAIVTGQRREDIISAQRRDIREGHWWCQQGKTGNRVAIPMGIRLEVFGMSLAEVLKQCSATNILSPHIIHQTHRGGGSKLGAKIRVGSVSYKFRDAVARLGADWGGKTPPTFHEIRSLSSRLYLAQGNVDTKQLLGHKSDASAALYADARGGWVTVSVK